MAILSPVAVWVLAFLLTMWHRTFEGSACMLPPVWPLVRKWLSPVPPLCVVRLKWVWVLCITCLCTTVIRRCTLPLGMVGRCRVKLLRTVWTMAPTLMLIPPLPKLWLTLKLTVQESPPWLGGGRPVVVFRGVVVRLVVRLARLARVVVFTDMVSVRAVAVIWSDTG